MKSKEHLLVIKVHFDKPVTRAAALRAARNQVDPVSAIFATIAEEEDDGWTTMQIKGVQSRKPA